MGVRASLIAVLAAALPGSGGALAQIPPPPGHYTGTWTNHMFSSTGPIRADLRILGNTVTITIDVDGNVLGIGNPPAFTATGTINAGAFSAQINNHEVLGNVSVNITAGGNITITGTNVPGGFITGYSATGTLSAIGTLNLNGTVNFILGPSANTTITAVRTAYSTLGSGAEIAQGRFGQAVAGTTDMTGDNRGDMLVGAPQETHNALAQGGRVYLLHGWGNTIARTLGSPSNEANGHFGWSVASVPDVNGDGRADIVVGAPDEDPSTSPDGSGRAYIFSGANGAHLRTLVSANPEIGGKFGWSVAGVPDLNGDGRGDVIVGAPSEDPGAAPTDAGRVYVFSGQTGVRLFTLAAGGALNADFFGFSVSGVPDANGDGNGDILVGIPQSLDSVATGRFGRALLFSGANGAFLRGFTSPAGEANGRFGWSVGGVPDANGDGRGDIVIGAPEEDPGTAPEGAGRAYIYNGSSGALLFTLNSATPTLGGHFGFSVAGMTDTSGDNRGDVIVGAPGEGSADQGRAYIRSGANGSLVMTLASRYPEAGGNYGASVSAVATVNGGTRSEALCGAPNEDPDVSPASAGRAYLTRR